MVMTRRKPRTAGLYRLERRVYTSFMDTGELPVGVTVYVSVRTCSFSDKVKDALLYCPIVQDETI